MASLATIGNATLLTYEGNQPILTADPWLGEEDEAYFGSWNLTHKIPSSLKDDIFNSEYIWFSHGHPDHLNPDSLKKIKGKKILLPDHVGGRIASGLLNKDFIVEILPDRKWVKISKEVSIMCITTLIQDSILLLEVNNNLFINLNDAGSRGATNFIKKISKNYNKVYLLSLSGYGDADMINFYDESGDFVVPPAKNNIYVGEDLSLSAKSVGANIVIPFSSHHQYQRSDSVWAQEYITPMHAYTKGLHDDIEFIPAFVRIDCISGKYEEIKPEPLKIVIKAPEIFGDNWSDELDKNDTKIIDKYFQEKELISKRLGFINFVVGGKTHTTCLNKKSNKGITFTVPRSSLMKSVQFEIFDDLLIGNFMKTTLHNMNSLYECDFNFLLTKYGDNGLAKTEAEVKKYLQEYKKRSGRQYIYDSFLASSANILNRVLTNKSSPLRRMIKSIYYKIK